MLAVGCVALVILYAPSHFLVGKSRFLQMMLSSKTEASVFLRLRLRSLTMVLPSHSLGNSKSHAQAFSSGGEIESTSQSAGCGHMQDVGIAW